MLSEDAMMRTEIPVHSLLYTKEKAMFQRLLKEFEASGFGRGAEKFFTSGEKFIV